ncbi:hypothetical protein [Roseococcus sp.]|uniref:hypothetical protein n=1 Tax=Roseococcus sp. TaxID=2109646 RepID=UPI003BAD4889
MPSAEVAARRPALSKATMRAGPIQPWLSSASWTPLRASQTRMPERPPSAAAMRVPSGETARWKMGAGWFGSRASRRPLDVSKT